MKDMTVKEKKIKFLEQTLIDIDKIMATDNGIKLHEEMEALKQDTEIELKLMRM